MKSTQNSLKFGLVDISNMPILILKSKINFMKYLPPLRPKLVPKIKNAQNLLKFSTLCISNISISILMSKMVFMKYYQQSGQTNSKVKISLKFIFDGS